MDTPNSQNREFWTIRLHVFASPSTNASYGCVHMPMHDTSHACRRGSAARVDETKLQSLHAKGRRDLLARWPGGDQQRKPAWETRAVNSTQHRPATFLCDAHSTASWPNLLAPAKTSLAREPQTRRDQAPCTPPCSGRAHPRRSRLCRGWVARIAKLPMLSSAPPPKNARTHSHPAQCR